MHGPIPKRKKPTKDKVWKAAIHALPCVLQRRWGRECGGHITQQHAQGYAFRGKSQRACDYDSFPLCKAHHQGIEGNFKNSIEHMGQRPWKTKYGPEEKYIKETQAELLAMGYEMKEPK